MTWVQVNLLYLLLVVGGVKCEANSNKGERCLTRTTGSSLSPPVFRDGPGDTIYVKEGTKVDLTTPIASYSAESQIPEDPTLFFNLINERLKKSVFENGWKINEDATFRAIPDKDNQKLVHIYLAKQLDYETIISYKMTLQVRNIANLVTEANITVQVEDENDMVPFFFFPYNIESGKVMEGEDPGTDFMQVIAMDNDGTYPNNRVTYKISDEDYEIMEKFEIDSNTGVITTKVKLDCEEKDVYALTVIAMDGWDGYPEKINQVSNKFRVVVTAKNHTITE